MTHRKRDTFAEGFAFIIVVFVLLVIIGAVVVA